MVKITVVNDMLANLQKDIGNAFEFFVVCKRRFEDATNSAVGDADGSEVPEVTLKFYPFSSIFLSRLEPLFSLSPFSSIFLSLPHLHLPCIWTAGHAQRSPCYRELRRAIFSISIPFLVILSFSLNISFSFSLYFSSSFFLISTLFLFLFFFIPSSLYLDSRPWTVIALLERTEKRSSSSSSSCALVPGENSIQRCSQYHYLSITHNFISSRKEMKENELLCINTWCL